MKFKEGKIIERFVAKDGREIIIRYPSRNDVREVWKFYNKVIKETEFLSRITPVSLKEEKKWISEKINEIKKKNSIQLLAECNGKIIGSCSVERNKTQTTAHTGVYGICILQDYTGIGLGKRMTKDVLDLAKSNMKLKAVQLNVYDDNKAAQNMYKKFGFKAVGALPDWIKHRTKTKSDIIMYKVLK